MSSRPLKAPQQMNRMSVVSIWISSCCGRLRAPSGVIVAVLPSRILSSACCTPSPETSRVGDGRAALARDLVDLVDADDAARGLLDVAAGGAEQRLDDALDVLADVAGLGQRGGVRDRERHVELLGERLGEQGLARAGRARSAGCCPSAARRRSACRAGRCACSGCRPRPTARAWRPSGRRRSGRALRQSLAAAGTSGAPTPPLWRGCRCTESRTGRR